MIQYALGAFLVGVCAATFVTGPLLFWSSIAAISVLIAFARTKRMRLLIAIALVAVNLGGLRFGHAQVPSELESWVERSVTVSGFTDSDFRTTTSGGQFYFHVSELNGKDTSERILVRTEAWPPFELGTPLILDGIVEYPWVGEDSFDYRAYLKKDGVRVLLDQPHVQAASSVSVTRWSAVQIRVRQGLYAIRDFLADGVRQGISEPAAAYINGILLGMRDDLPDDVTEAFARTGTTHVLAISGYNVAIIAQAFMLFCLRFTERRKAVWWAIAGIAAFTVITGATASVVRAAIMGSLILVGGAWGQRMNVMTLILFTAVAMVILNPYLLRYDIGFQLSFAAVVGLVYLAPMIELAWAVPDRMQTMWQLASATGAANVATLPLILYYFGTFPVYALPANLAILPVIPYAMAWGAFSGVAASVAPSLAGFTGLPAWALATWQLTVVKAFSWLPGATVEFAISPVIVVLSYAAMFVMYIHGNRRSGHTTT